MQTTPKQYSNEHYKSTEQYSPVIVPESPVSKGTNLTGNPRLVRDLSADIHASIQQWNNIHLHGISILKAITQTKVDESYSEELQNLCDDLEKDCNSLADIVDNLKQLSHQMKAVASLHKSKEYMFLTWPVEIFGDVANEIYKAYEKDLAVRYKVLENVAHDHKESWKMLHLATWVHQTQISEKLTRLLESMLLETGHR
ncbi:cyclin-dependent kinase 2-interacting protein isoform X2 [Cephus cinctus]|uniref:Cyclin-dependent kinase 2-interacting protein isoform X2 n=1 Tax=Cephus cinctus TaxID=211228 RepID=A0AAJ7C4B6_CEPCN|nr:cyclin-dependent kinase 2-interacting protein isoform X2 [Cephus cinctus]